MSEGTSTTAQADTYVANPDIWYIDESSGDVCIGSTTLSLAYTALSFLTIMFFVLGNQYKSSGRKDYEREKAYFIHKY